MNPYTFINILKILKDLVKIIDLYYTPFCGLLNRWHTTIVIKLLVNTH